MKFEDLMKKINKKTELISAFPGTGKSHFFNNSNKKVLDSDSSKFDKSLFPKNYINHIKENLGKVDVILISSHEDVRNALVENNLKFTLVYPNIDLKDEYLQRYRDRKSPESFIKLIDNNWEKWLTQLQNQRDCDHVVLGKGEYISDMVIK